MFPEPVVAADPSVHPVAERHHHVWEPTLDPLVVGIRNLAGILWLVAALTRNIRLNPLPPLTFP